MAKYFAISSVNDDDFTTNPDVYLDALKFLKQAFDLGNKKAEAYVGLFALLLLPDDLDDSEKDFYNAGKKLTNNMSREEGFQHIQHAADRGDDDALFLLANMYLEGNDFCERDEKKGLLFLKKAAEMGQPEAKDKLAELESSKTVLTFQIPN